MTDILRELVHALADGSVRIVDLTQPLGSDTPVLPLPPQFGASWPFELVECSNYDERGPSWYRNNFRCGEHTGTHFDAPVHWISGRDYPDNTTDTIAVERFIAPACVIDVSSEAGRNPDFLLEPHHVLSWESQHGRIPEGSWVLMRTDWSRRADAAAYLNAGADGYHFPGPHPDLPGFLVGERNAVGFGAETIGTDAGQAARFDPPFPGHRGMHGANRFGLAGLTNLDLLPATGSVLITPPLKIVRGSGSPCRVLALVPSR